MNMIIFPADLPMLLLGWNENISVKHSVNSKILYKCKPWTSLLDKLINEQANHLVFIG